MTHCEGADNIYYNLRIDNIYNNLPNTNGYGLGVTKRARTFIKTGRIVPKQSDYKFAIEFINISAISLPIFYAEILEGLNDDINATQYGICLTHLPSGEDFPQRIIYENDIDSFINSTNLPRSPLDNNGLQDYTTAPLYYAVYTIERMVSLINRAYYDSWKAMKAAHPSNSPECPPYLFYDAGSKRIALVINHDYVRSPLAHIYHNSQMEKFVESIRIEVTRGYLTGSIDTFKEFRFKTELARPYASNNGAFGFPQQSDIINPPADLDRDYLPWKNIGPDNFYCMLQEYDSIYFWNNTRSLVLYSSSISVRNEYLPFPINPNSINSTRITNMSLASPSVVSTKIGHQLVDGEKIYLAKGDYQIDGITPPADQQYKVKVLTGNTFQLFNLDASPVNITSYNPAVICWAAGGLTSNIGQFNNPSGSVLSYFDLINQGGVDWRQNLVSSPSYRKYLDLLSNEDLSSVDLDIYIQLTNGALVPLFLGINESIAIKFTFKRD